MSNRYNPIENDNPSDEYTVESLGQYVEELQGEIRYMRQFLDEHLDATRCENCGHIHVRAHMLAPFGLDMGSGWKELPKSSRWFCGYCVDAARMRGGNQPEVRRRIGEWLATGYGREFLIEMDSHYAHLGEGANQAPVAKFLREEYAAEIAETRRRKAR